MADPNEEFLVDILDEVNRLKLKHKKQFSDAVIVLVSILCEMLRINKISPEVAKTFFENVAESYAEGIDNIKFED